jgi:hypothetical protein
VHDAAERQRQIGQEVVGADAAPHRKIRHRRQCEWRVASGE